jgi:hypothetical protein
MSKLIILYSLKAGVTKSDFETWVREIDQPAMRGLARVKSFNTYAAQSLLMGEGEPSVDYVEIFDITDLAGFTSEDMPGETVQSIMGQFMGFADTPQFIICEDV